jgi:hypothetical protein
VSSVPISFGSPIEAIITFGPFVFGFITLRSFGEFFSFVSFYGRATTGFTGRIATAAAFLTNLLSAFIAVSVFIIGHLEPPLLFWPLRPGNTPGD